MKKLDYTKNPEAQRFVAVKAAEHVPGWRKDGKASGADEWNIARKPAENSASEEENAEGASLLRLEDLF